MKEKLDLESLLNEMTEGFSDKEKAKILADKIRSVYAPSVIDIPNDSIQETYSFGAFTLIRAKTCIIFKSTGFRIVVRPYLRTLYGQLDFIMNKKKDYDAGNLDKEEMDLFDGYVSVTTMLLSLPLDVFSNDKYLFDVAKYIKERRSQYYEERMNKGLEFEADEETAFADDLFEASVKESEHGK